MSAAGIDPPLPSPTPSRPIPGSTAPGYRSEPGSSAMAMALGLVSGGQTNSIAGSSAAASSLADLHQDMRDTTALLESGLDSFSARLHDTIPVEMQQQARDLLALAQSYLALAQSIVDNTQAQLDTTSHLLSSALRNMATKATRFTPPGALPTSDEYAAGLPALAYGVLERAKNIIDNLLTLAPADRNSPVEETVLEFIRGTKLSLDNTLQQVLLWQNLGKELLLGEKEKADKRSEDLQHRLLDLQLEMCGVKSELKDAQGAGNKYEEEICCLMGDLENVQKDAQRWKLTAEATENKISSLKRELTDTQADREKAAKDYEKKISSLKRELTDTQADREKAAKDYEKKISNLKMDFKRDLDQMELAVQKEAGARAARESAEKAKKMLLSNYEDSMPRT